MSGIKHTKVSTQPDDLDPDVVSASDWNADHDTSSLALVDVPLIAAALKNNLLINGGFHVNVLQKKGTVTLAANEYGHDGWIAGASGCVYTFASVNGVRTLTIASGTLRQFVERRKLKTGTHCLSWSGTAQGRFMAGTYGASGVTGTLARLPSQYVEFNAGTLSGVCLVRGSDPQVYADIDIEEARRQCHRYCFKLDTSIMSGDSPWRFMFPGQWTGATGFAWITLDVPMLRTPDLVLEGGTTGFFLYDLATASPKQVTAIGRNLVSTKQFILIDTLSSYSGTLGAPFYFMQNVDQRNGVRFESRLMPVPYFEQTALALRFEDIVGDGAGLVYDETGINAPVLKGTAAIVPQTVFVGDGDGVLKMPGSDGSVLKVEVLSGSPLQFGANDFTVSFDVNVSSGGYLMCMNGGYGYAWADWAILSTSGQRLLVALRSTTAQAAGTGPDIANYVDVGSLPFNTWNRVNLRRVGSTFTVQIGASVVWTLTDSRPLSAQVNLAGLGIGGGAYTDAGDYAKECVNGYYDNIFMINGAGVDTNAINLPKLYQ